MIDLNFRKDKEFSRFGLFTDQLWTTVVYWTFGITWTVYLSLNSSAVDTDASPVWRNLLAVTIVRFIGGFLFIIKGFLLAQASDEDHAKKISQKFFLTRLSEAAVLGLMIWSMVLFYGDNQSAKHYAGDHFPDLYNLLYTEVILFYINMAVLGIYLLVAICFIGCAVARN